MKAGSGRIGVIVGCAAVCFLSVFFAPTTAASLPMTAVVLAMGAVLLRRSVPALPGRTEGLFFAACAALAAAVFVHRFLDVLRDRPGGLSTPAAIVFGLGAAAAAFLFFFRGFSLFREREGDAAGPERLSFAIWAPLLLTAAAVITLCSKSSPLYPLNDWTDSNCYFTVGKAMVHGKVLYRDIYEQKGILLYLMHTAAYFVSRRSFLGMWLWEIAAAAAFLIVSAKSLLLFAPRRAVWLLPPVAALVYTLPCFVFGDLAEEFCLPLIAWALYTGLRALREERPLSRREWLWIGITSGCVLWIKYSMVAFYLGWVLVPAFEAVRRRDARSFGRMVCFTALGVAAVTAPVIVYFAVNGALGDLWTAYFYNNIFLYHRSGDAPLFFRVVRNLLNTFQGAAPMYGSILLALPWLLGRKDRRYAAQVILSMAALIMGTLNANQMHIYYAFILAVYMPLACLPLLELWDGLCLSAPKMPARTAAFAAAALIVYTNCTNFYLLEYSREELPQYRFSAVMERYDDPTLLNYRFLDGGFYTVSGIVPEEKYFCVLNLPLPEIKEEQDRCVAEGRTDFVVTMDRKKTSELYECIEEQTFPREGDNHTYRLFIRKDLLDR